MRTVKWNAFLSGLCGFAVVLGVVAAGAHADVTTEKGSSVLIFPKVRADGTFDTIIQIANTGNSPTEARCFYVDASLVNPITQTPCTLPGQLCTPLCQETDFSIFLTRQQPTHWVVSAGRNINPSDKLGTDGAGFDPGFVPPVSNFTGELKCIEVDDTGAPINGNHLKGEATLEVISGPDRGDVSKYNGIGIQANNEVSPANPLLLDGNMYNACPAKLIVDHFATGAEDPVAAGDFAPTVFSSSESTELTLMPCSEDFEHQLWPTVTVQFAVISELEQRLSFSTSLGCFLNTELANIGSLNGSTSTNPFTLGAIGTDIAQTEITPVANQDGSQNAVIGVAEQITTVAVGGATSTSRAAYNLHSQGDLIPAKAPDQIVLPGDP